MNAGGVRSAALLGGRGGLFARHGVPEEPLDVVWQVPASQLPHDMKRGALRGHMGVARSRPQEGQHRGVVVANRHVHVGIAVSPTFTA